MMVKYGLLLLMFLIVLACNKQVRFDSERWKRSGGELIMTDNRLNMTRDLLDSGLLLNKTQVEIDSLLGESITVANSDKEARLYLVKEVYSLDVDPDKLICLAVKFDAGGQSVSTEIMEF